MRNMVKTLSLFKQIKWSDKKVNLKCECLSSIEYCNCHAKTMATMNLMIRASIGHYDTWYQMVLHWAAGPRSRWCACIIHVIKSGVISNWTISEVQWFSLGSTWPGCICLSSNVDTHLDHMGDYRVHQYCGRMTGKSSVGWCRRDRPVTGPRCCRRYISCESVSRLAGQLIMCSLQQVAVSSCSQCVWHTPKFICHQLITSP